MINKTIFFLILFLCPLVALAKWPPDCSGLERFEEKELVSILKKRSLDENFYCYKDDEITKESLRVFQMIYNLIAQMKGLPRPLLNKWNHLRYDQIQMFGTDLNLCLQNGECSSSLMAKNFRFRKKGIILIHREQWRNLSSEDKFSLIWHEVLSILGFEKNSYEYSSMVDFSMECDSKVVSPDSFSATCYMVARFIDPSFLR